jgi:hypothetical protein
VFVGGQGGGRVWSVGGRGMWEGVRGCWRSSHKMGSGCCLCVVKGRGCVVGAGRGGWTHQQLHHTQMSWMVHIVHQRLPMRCNNQPCVLVCTSGNVLT